MKLQYIFPEFFTEEFLGFYNPSLEEYCYNMSKESLGRQISNYGGWQSNSFTGPNKTFDPLLKIIEDKLNALKEHLNFKDEFKLKIYEYWINLNFKDDFNAVHDHPGSFFSGVYYIKVPENSGNLELKRQTSPHNFVIYDDMIQKYNSFNSYTWSITPKDDMLVIFPSWLQHWVTPSGSSELRISLAFNSRMEKD